MKREIIFIIFPTAQKKTFAVLRRMKKGLKKHSIELHNVHHKNILLHYYRQRNFREDVR